MNTQKLFLLAALLFGIMVFSGCKKDNGDENTRNNPHNNLEIPEFYALDISEETDWNYVVVADNEEGSSVWFNTDRNTSIPTTMFFKPFSNQDNGFVVKFKSNGLPDYAVFGDTIVVFENFRDTRCDIAVIYPNISVKNFNNIEIGVNFDEIINSSLLRSNNSEAKIAFEHSVKYIGTTLTVISAVFGVMALTATAPVWVTTAAVVGLVAAGITVYNNYFREESNYGVGYSSTIVGSVATKIGCLTPGGMFSCLSGIAATSFSLMSDTFTFADSRQGLIDTTKANMKQNLTNPNNPDNPNNPGNMVNKTLTITLTSNMRGGSESYTGVLKPNQVAQIGGYTGRWEQGGNSLRINWKLNNTPDCTYSLSGTLNGNSYTGTYTHYDGATLYDRGTFSGRIQ